MNQQRIKLKQLKHQLILALSAVDSLESGKADTIYQYLDEALALVLDELADES